MILTICPGKGLVFAPEERPMRTCCACLERPATLFGGYFCGDCYRSEPLAYLAACRAARLQGLPHPDQCLTTREACGIASKRRWAKYREEKRRAAAARLDPATRLG